MPDATGSNLPIVFQQAGNVSRLQEMVQRGPEQQQAAAAQESLERFQKEQSQVPQAVSSNSGGKVQTDSKGKREWRRQKDQNKPRPAETKPEPDPQEHAGGLVDLII